MLKGWEAPLGSSKSAGGPAGEGQSIGDAARSKVQDHYASEGMASRILAALRAARDGEAGPITANALASRDHLRGRELKCSPEEFAAANSSGERWVMCRRIVKT